MRLPAPLLRNNPQAHKNQFGHLLILAGSPTMLGAAALTSLAAMRAGAGLVTLGIPRSLNSVVQKKISNVVMTLPLPQTRRQTLSLTAYPVLKKIWKKYQAAVIGPGLSRDTSTQKLIRHLIETMPLNCVIDADGLNALQGHVSILKRNSSLKILTPHSGEMERLTNLSIQIIERNRQDIALKYAKEFQVILVLKGHHTVVAAPDGRCYINQNGNVGMATAGSGDVLSGIIGALLAQEVDGFEAARWGVFWHGLAGDLAARAKSKTSLIASDIIDFIPEAFKRMLLKK